MENSRKRLEEEIEELELLVSMAQKDVKSAPQGELHVSNCKNTSQYYWRKDKKEIKGKYIRKSNEKFIRDLAQKDYAQRMQKVLMPIIMQKKQMLKKLIEIDAHQQLLDVEASLSLARQKYITPYVQTDDRYTELWECEKRKQKENAIKSRSRRTGKFMEAETEIYTEKGECVRSKSEKILADKLYMMQIPYIYELPLLIEGYGYIKPDFTVLNKRTRKEYYWEHFGMMSDTEYCEKAIKKIEGFAMNGIMPGKNLILTYETQDHPLNMKMVEKLVQEYLL